MSKYEISKSSLLSLKAEILRKKEESIQIRAENEEKISNLQRNPNTKPIEIKNKGIDKRIANDLTHEEENLLKASREALEAKAIIYDKLSGKAALTGFTDDETEFNRRFLVRFERKQTNRKNQSVSSDEDDFDEQNKSYHTNNPDEQWVEYVDCLGRTRTCLRKDLPDLKKNDLDLAETVRERQNLTDSRAPSLSQAHNSNRRSLSPSSSRTNNKNQSSPRNNVDDQQEDDNQLRRLHEKWAQDEAELASKSDVHYQDVLFDEARTHGVGYYSFSRDSAVRQQEQDALRRLRTETATEQAKSAELRAARDRQMAARVLAAQNRKRAREGLPPLEPEQQKQTDQSEEASKSSENGSKIPAENKGGDEGVLGDILGKRAALRRTHVRPWDIGKEGVASGSKSKHPHYEYTQEEWVEKRRRERVAEFGPKVSSATTAPPFFNSYTESSSSSKRSKTKNSEAMLNSGGISIEAGLKFLRDQVEKNQ